MSDGKLVRSMSKDKMGDYQMGYYDYNRYGCPWRIFYSIGFKPKFDIYDGDKRIDKLATDFTIFENRGLKLYRLIFIVFVIFFFNKSIENNKN